MHKNIRCMQLEWNPGNHVRNNPGNHVRNNPGNHVRNYPGNHVRNNLTYLLNLPASFFFSSLFCQSFFFICSFSLSLFLKTVQILFTECET